jgi:hypothetical protein
LSYKTTQQPTQDKEVKQKKQFQKEKKETQFKFFHCRRDSLRRNNSNVYPFSQSLSPSDFSTRDGIEINYWLEAITSPSLD